MAGHVRLAQRSFVLMPALLAILVAGGCDMSSGAEPMPTAVQPCSLWFNFPADRHSNQESPYLGCANVMNLRAMIDRPADLAGGRTLGPASGERESRAVEAYEQGKVKSMPASETAKPIMAVPGLTGGATP